MSAVGFLPLVGTAGGRRDLGRMVVRDVLPAKVGFDQEHLDQVIGWLTAAVGGDGGGVGHGYRLGTGWLPPTAADTAQVIPTLLRYHAIRPDRGVAEVADHLGATLLGSQSGDGSFPASGGGSVPAATGEALLALLALVGAGAGSRHEQAAQRAGRWLAGAQLADGSWPTASGQDGRVAWALHRAATALDDATLGEAAGAHVHWLAGRQRSDGWIDGGGELTSAEIGRVLEGAAEIGIAGDELALLVASDLLAGVERAYRRPGSGVRLRWRNHLAARISISWRATSGGGALMEGSARVALVAARLARLGGPDASRIRRFGDEILDAVRSAQILHGGPGGLSGGVPAMAPLWVAPTTDLLVSAAKPFADALMERRGDGGPEERLG